MTELADTKTAFGTANYHDYARRFFGDGDETRNTLVDDALAAGQDAAWLLGSVAASPPATAIGGINNQVAPQAGTWVDLTGGSWSIPGTGQRRIMVELSAYVTAVSGTPGIKWQYVCPDYSIGYSQLATHTNQSVTGHAGTPTVQTLALTAASHMLTYKLFILANGGSAYRIQFAQNTPHASNTTLNAFFGQVIDMTDV